MDTARAISSLFVPPGACERPAAIVGNRQISFAGLRDDVAALAATLQTRQGQRWLLLSEDAYALAVGFLATLYAGRTVVLPANLQIGHVSDLADQIDGILAHEQETPPEVKTVSILANDAAADRAALEPFDAARAEIILHTSGTTGQPVAIHKSLNCLEAEVATLDGLFRPTESYVVLATVPAHHIYGLLFRILWPLAAGQPFDAGLVRYPEELERAVETKANILLVSSPAFLGRALGVVDVDALKGHLVGAFSSGGPLPAEVAAVYNASLTRPIIEVYGSTETGGIGYRSVLDASRPAPLTPLPGVTLSVDSKSDILSIKSPFLSSDESFQTEDRVRLLPDGRFELLGRADRIVKIEERRISLTEVEQKLLSRAEISAIRVEVIKGNTGRQVLGALIVPTLEGWAALARDGKRALIKILRGALMPYLDLAAIPRKWRFVKKMPETPQGKSPLSQFQAMFDDSPNDVTRPIILRRETAPAELRLRLKLPPELKYFDGHFADYPILAGVIQLGWAIDYGREVFPLDGAFQRIEALKFFQVLCAGEEVTLDLKFEREKGKLHFRYSSAEHEHSAGRIHFGKAA